MGKIISIANQKGGVGKTTSTYNIAAALSLKGFNVLMIDMDIQCSLTHCCTLEKDISGYEDIGTCDLFENNVDPLDCCFPVMTMYPTISWDKPEEVKDKDWEKVKLYIIPSSPKMAETQRNINMVGGVNKFKIFRKNMEVLKEAYDYIILDCLPTLDGLLTASLSASDGVIIPVKPEIMSYDGIKYLIDTIESVQKTHESSISNKNLKVLGVIVTMYRGQVKEHKELLERLKTEHNVLGIIPMSASVTSGVAQGLPVIKKRPTSVAAQEYIRISSENL